MVEYTQDGVIFRNMVQSVQGLVDCEVLHETLGWIPFSAGESDAGVSSSAVRQYLYENHIKVEDLPISSAVAEEVIMFERMWRNEELRLADMELLRVEDFDKGAIGTAVAWRQYRCQLRGWPEDGKFPTTEARPIRPK